MVDENVKVDQDSHTVVEIMEDGTEVEFEEVIETTTTTTTTTVMKGYQELSSSSKMNLLLNNIRKSESGTFTLNFDERNMNAMKSAEKLRLKGMNSWVRARVGMEDDILSKEAMIRQYDEDRGVVCTLQSKERHFNEVLIKLQDRCDIIHNYALQQFEQVGRGYIRATKKWPKGEEDESWTELDQSPFAVRFVPLKEFTSENALLSEFARSYDPELQVVVCALVQCKPYCDTKECSLCEQGFATCARSWIIGEYDDDDNDLLEEGEDEDI